jgi:hypothetical protein
MESTGFPDCIQISQVTADLLLAAGKQAWIKPRTDMVNAKGKGLMQTYVLEMNKKSTSSSGGSVADQTVTKGFDDVGELHDIHLPGSTSTLHICSKNVRLVEWIADILIVFIKDIAVRRCRTKSWKRKSIDEVTFEKEIGRSVIGEVKEIVTLPSIINTDSANDACNTDIEIDPLVGEQLRHYLSKISLLYPENPCKFRHLFIFCKQMKIGSILTRRVIFPLRTGSP